MCLELAPFKECGFGDCVNGECVCYPGVIQNVELLYHPVPSNITTYCDYNVEGSVATTAVLLAFSLCVFIVQVLAIHNAQQVSVCRGWSVHYYKQWGLLAETPSANPCGILCIVCGTKYSVGQTSRSTMGLRLRVYFLHGHLSNGLCYTDHYLSQ